MGFVPFNDVIKLEAIFLEDGQWIENVHYYIVDATPNVDTAIDLADKWVTWWDAEMKSHVSQEVSLRTVKCTIMENETDPGIEFTTGLPIAGTSNFPPAPNNVTVAIRWLTNLRGRSYRGRTYHIGLTTGGFAQNHIVTTEQAALKLAYEHMLTMSVDVGPAVKCIASRVHNGVERTTGVATPCVGVAIDTTLDSQRRRLPGRGR